MNGYQSWVLAHVFKSFSKLHSSVYLRSRGSPLKNIYLNLVKTFLSVAAKTSSLAKIIQYNNEYRCYIIFFILDGMYTAFRCSSSPPPPFNVMSIYEFFFVWSYIFRENGFPLVTVCWAYFMKISH